MSTSPDDSSSVATPSISTLSNFQIDAESFDNFPDQYLEAQGHRLNNDGDSINIFENNPVEGPVGLHSHSSPWMISSPANYADYQEVFQQHETQLLQQAISSASLLAVHNGTSVKDVINSLMTSNVAANQTPATDSTLSGNSTWSSCLNEQQQLIPFTSTTTSMSSTVAVATTTTANTPVMTENGNMTGVPFPDKPWQIYLPTIVTFMQLPQQSDESSNSASHSRVCLEVDIRRYRTFETLSLDGKLCTRVPLIYGRILSHPSQRDKAQARPYLEHLEKIKSGVVPNLQTPIPPRGNITSMCNTYEPHSFGWMSLSWLARVYAGWVNCSLNDVCATVFNRTFLSSAGGHKEYPLNLRKIEWQNEPTQMIDQIYFPFANATRWVQVVSADQKQSKWQQVEFISLPPGLLPFWVDAALKKVPHEELKMPRQSFWWGWRQESTRFAKHTCELIEYFPGLSNVPMTYGKCTKNFTLFFVWWILLIVFSLQVQEALQQVTQHATTTADNASMSMQETVSVTPVPTRDEESENEGHAQTNERTPGKRGRPKQQRHSAPIGAGQPYTPGRRGRKRIHKT